MLSSRLSLLFVKKCIGDRTGKIRIMLTLQNPRFGQDRCCISGHVFCYDAVCSNFCAVTDTPTKNFTASTEYNIRANCAPPPMRNRDLLENSYIGSYYDIMANKYACRTVWKVRRRCETCTSMKICSEGATMSCICPLDIE